MAKLMVSSHPLAVEQLRHASGVRNGREKLKVPREERLCRFCNSVVESPEHALLRCEGSARLKELRDRFYTSVHERRPDLLRPATDLDADPALKALIATPDLSAHLATFVRRVFEVFSTVELT